MAGMDLEMKEMTVFENLFSLRLLQISFILHAANIEFRSAPLSDPNFRILPAPKLVSNRQNGSRQFPRDKPEIGAPKSFQLASYSLFSSQFSLCLFF